MKKIVIKEENKYKAYLTLMKGLLNLTDREIDLLVEFDKVNHFPIEDSRVKNSIATTLGISKKTLHIMLKNLTDKNILSKTKRNSYDRTSYIIFNNEILINII